jgi:hypothetical protein
LKKKFIAPGKEKFALKIKDEKSASSEIPKKIKAPHIAQLYDKYQQFCCLSVQALNSLWTPSRQRVSASLATCP